MKALFSTGHIVATPAALELMERMGTAPHTLLERHLAGDWGNLDTHDAALNDDSVANGGRIMSAYDVGAGSVWIVTEDDRSATTFLLPSDY